MLFVEIINSASMSNKSDFSTLPAQAVIREVGLRDGLQSIPTRVSTAHKCEWIADAVAAVGAVTRYAWHAECCGGSQRSTAHLTISGIH